MFHCEPVTVEKTIIENRDPGVRLIEEFAIDINLLWIHLAYRGGLGRDFAFRLMRRQ